MEPQPTKHAPQRTLLVVDDEEDIVLSIEALVEASLPGTRVVTALSGPAALALLKTTPVDVVVTDYRMPGMDGIEFLHAAAPLVPRAPRVLLSAYGDPALAARARTEAGVVRLLDKPLDPESFLALLDSLLRGEALRQRSAVDRK